MVLCDNVFCTEQAVEFEYVMLAGRRFCCLACAEDWQHQNEVLAEAASPFQGASKTVKPRLSEKLGMPKRFVEGSKY